MTQLAIPVMQFRAGSSKGLFFKSTDLPTDPEARNRILLAAMDGVGPGDPRQIDGLGGATSLTSKIAIVSLSETPGVELDYLFAQVVVGAGQISWGQTCGNMLAGVLPFAIESGMLPATTPTTTARIRMLNTGGVCELTIQTPNGQVEYGSSPTVGTARVDGVPGTAAPIVCTYLNTAGATCGALLPTGKAIDWGFGIGDWRLAQTTAYAQSQIPNPKSNIPMTCIDNGMPVVLLRAADLGLTGYETPAELEANIPLKTQLEHIRLAAGLRMNLGDVSQKTIPKLCLIAPPQHGGMVSTRMFIPHVVHEAIGVLAAVSIATACVLPGSVADGIAVLPGTGSDGYSVEHPTGEMTVTLTFDHTANIVTVRQSGVIRTARLLNRGEVFVPISG